MASDTVRDLINAATGASIALNKIALAGDARAGHIEFRTKADMGNIATRAHRALDAAIIAALAEMAS